MPIRNSGRCHKGNSNQDSDQRFRPGFKEWPITEVTRAAMETAEVTKTKLETADGNRRWKPQMEAISDTMKSNHKDP